MDRKTEKASERKRKKYFAGLVAGVMAESGIFWALRLLFGAGHCCGVIMAGIELIWPGRNIFLLMGFFLPLCVMMRRKKDD